MQTILRMLFQLFVLPAFGKFTITISGLDGNPFGTRDIDASPNNFCFSFHKLVLSGSYVTGGDTLDFSTVAGLIPSGGLPILAFAEGNGSGTQQSAGGGYYIVLSGNALNNWKLKIFAAAGTELAAGAYVAQQTGDGIFLTVLWRKLL